MNTADSLQDVVTHFVTRTRRLHSLPAVAMRVLELTDQPSIDARKLTECIEKDPALTSKILRVVNSSVFGCSQPVASLQQAVARLGFRPLKMLVLCFSLPKNLACGGSTEVLARYWRHTVFKAVAAREIAESFYELPGDEAFVGGLLQNLGILVLIQDLGSSYENFLQSIWNDGANLAVEEVAVLGFDHKFLSASLLEHWKLPANLVEAIGAPHDVDVLSTCESPGQAVRQVLHLAELAATFLVEPRPTLLDELLQVAHRYRGLTMAQLESLMSKLESSAPQLAEILSLELPGGTSYSALLLNAYRQLGDALDDATSSLLAEGGTADDLFLELQPRSATSPPRKSPDVAAAAREVTRAVQLPNRAASKPSRADTIPCWGVDETDPASLIPKQAKTAATLSSFPWSTREGLVARISVAVGRCRQQRSSLSLLLAELDEVETVAFYCGVDQLPRVASGLGVALRDLGEAEGNMLQIGDARFVLVLDDCDRRRAVERAWRIVDGVRIWKFPIPPPSPAGLSVSIGIATLTMPPRSFPAEELLTAAERCLSGVQLSGGDGVKSIDIF